MAGFGDYLRAGKDLFGGMVGMVSGGSDPHGFGGKGVTGHGNMPVAPSYTPGLQAGTPMAGDYNMQGPGAAESFYGANRGAWEQPGVGMQWWQKNQGAFDDPGAAEDYFRTTQSQYADAPTTQNAQNYFSGWQDRSGELDADMGAFYDRAKERGVSDIDRSFASRGMYGSSAATGQIGQTVADLEAQRARDEAQYGLQRAAEQRAWSGQGGGLAASADASNLANAGMDLSYLQGGQGAAAQAQNAELARLMGAGGMAQGFDAADLARRNSGMNAALGAQDARRSRVQDMFANTAMPSMAMFNMQQQYYPQMFASDQALMDSSVLFGTGLAQDMVNADRDATQKDREDANMVGSVIGSVFGGMA